LLSNRFSLADALRQPSDYGEDAVCDTFELGVDFGQRARGLEDVEVAVEGDFVADFGLVVVVPGVGGVGEDFAREVGVHIFGERDVFRVAQRCVGDGMAFSFALGGVDDVAFRIAPGALDGDGAVAERFVFEDAGNRDAVAGFLAELAEEAGDVFAEGGWDVC
jgi:hypothetical protein